jgi:hypothetical protein
MVVNKNKIKDKADAPYGSPQGGAKKKNPF